MKNLLLITFGRTRYGVWEDAISAVISARPLHRLPLSPPAIAGIALLEERSAAIADLGACLGLPPLKRPQNGTFLIINASDAIAGFCVEGEIERFECPRELVLPLPLSVATPVSDSCAVRGASLVLIINIRDLHDRLKQGILDLPSPEPGLPARAFDLSGVRSVRMLSVGGARFCVDAKDTGYAVIGEDGIAPVPGRAGRLAGVALHDGAAVPVMLPGAFGKAAGRKGILLAGPQGARYGVAVDEDLGVVGGHDLNLLSLPVLAAKPWLPAAALAKGNICLLVDSDAFAVPEYAAADRPNQAAFTPSSLFPAQFRKIDTTIVEFSLLGTRHAVPQEEMKDNLPLLPFVPVPGTPEIVLGVAELRGKLLPVLDLAAIFGRPSTVGNKSRMMHLVNGDFQALVITDEVAGSRLLPVETHRQVPIALPHQVLYGCYLDAGMVRLILNVEALAVHFEKAAVRELVASLSPDIEVQSEQTHEALEQAAQVPPAAETVREPGEAPRPDRDRGAVTVEYETETAQTEAGDAVPAAALDEERAREETRIQAAVEAAARELAKQSVESEKLRAEDDARSRAVEQARLKAEADAKAIEEIRAQEEAERSRSEAETRARAEAEARAQEQETTRRKAADEAANKSAAEARKREEEEARRKAEDLAREAASVAVRRAAEEAEQQRAEEAKRETASEARVRAEEEAREGEREAARQRAAEDARKREEEEARRKAEGLAGIAAADNLKREADEARQRQDEEARRAEADAAGNSTMMPEPPTVQRCPPEPRPEESRPAGRKSGKRIGIALVIALLLVLVIYFVSIPKKPEQRGTPKPVKSDTTAPVPKNAPQPEKEPALYLAVPPGKAVPAPFVYTVVTGDNLWNIAKRFTGNPLNYPRVAKDNSIATPDLIFPGQRIQIRNEPALGR